MRLLKQSSTAQPLMFLMVDSTDHVTGKTGLTPTVTLSKNGGAFASPSGAVTEVANGWYKVAGNATDTNTLGPLILHATGTAADPVDVYFDVVAVDPQSSTAFITGVNSLAPPTNWNLLSIDSDGRVDMSKIRGSATAAVGMSAMGQYYDTETTLNVYVEGILGAVVTTIQAGLSTLTQTQITGGAYALNSASFAFNSALPMTTQQKADVNAEADTALADAKAGYATAVWANAARTLTSVSGLTIDANLVTVLGELNPASGLSDAGTQYKGQGHFDAHVVLMQANVLTGTAIDATAVTKLQTGVMMLSNYTAPDNASITAILADTNELQTDWANGGRLDLLLDDAASGSAPTVEQIDAELTEQHGAGSWQQGDAATGNGDISVDHNYGGTDELRILETGTDDPMDDALITAFFGGTVNGQTRTGSDGRWIAPLMLDAGSYTLVISKQGQQTQSVALVVVDA